VTSIAWVFLGWAAVAAVSDWIGVGERWKAVEYLSKPLTMVALVGMALSLHPEHANLRPWIVAALLFSLIGDVFLMLGPASESERAPRVERETSRGEGLFVVGLSSFLVAHVAYIVAFRLEGSSAGALAACAVVVAAAAALIGRRVVSGVQATDPALVVPVVAYIAVIAAMVACALATGNVFFGAGALLFMTSDSLIAWHRFVRPLSWAPLAIIVTYHVAQALLVTGMST
jgi:uncharacterized membrane protein YhhN